MLLIYTKQYINMSKIMKIISFYFKKKKVKPRQVLPSKRSILNKWGKMRLRKFQWLAQNPPEIQNAFEYITPHLLHTFKDEEKWTDGERWFFTLPLLRSFSKINLTTMSYMTLSEWNWIQQSHNLCGGRKTSFSHLTSCCTLFLLPSCCM